jgi:hypothetical protein
MAPKKIAREMSYVTGWFMLMGKLTVCVVIFAIDRANLID